MQILVAALGIVLLVAGILAMLALVWSRTPQGRLKPIFALVFGLARLGGGKQAEGVIDAAGMTNPETSRLIRDEFTKSTIPLSKLKPFAGRIEAREIAGPKGPLAVRIYTPNGSGPFPLLVYFHGGGFVVGNPDYTEAVTRGVAAQAPAIVVSVDYRMAPEHRFPAAVEDAHFATRWSFENADSLGAVRGPVAVGGDSAGGNLAAVVSLLDLLEGNGEVGLQVLIYPTVDITRSDRASQVAFAAGFGLSMRDVEACMARYVPDAVDRSDPRLSPLYAESLTGLPRALIFTAGFDVLCDEGTDYAERLEREGVAVRHVHQSALPHGYITMTRICSEANDDIQTIAEEVAALRDGSRKL